MPETSLTNDKKTTEKDTIFEIVKISFVESFMIFLFAGWANPVVTAVLILIFAPIGYLSIGAVILLGNIYVVYRILVLTWYYHDEFSPLDGRWLFVIFAFYILLTLPYTPVSLVIAVLVSFYTIVNLVIHRQHLEDMWNAIIAKLKTKPTEDD